MVTQMSTSAMPRALDAMLSKIADFYEESGHCGRRPDDLLERDDRYPPPSNRHRHSMVPIFKLIESCPQVHEPRSLYGIRHRPPPRAAAPPGRTPRGLQRGGWWSSSPPAAGGVISAPVTRRLADGRAAARVRALPPQGGGCRWSTRSRGIHALAVADRGRWSSTSASCRHRHPAGGFHRLRRALVPPSWRQRAAAVARRDHHRAVEASASA
jgi:hypothetical protein